MNFVQKLQGVKNIENLSPDNFFYAENSWK